MKVEFGNFEELLDALTPKKRISGEQRWAMKLYKRKWWKRKKREKERLARIAKKARLVGSAEGRARMAAAMAKIASGEPGRWLDVLRAMQPGEAYVTRDVESLTGLASNKVGLTLTRDLWRRGLASREAYKAQLTGILTKTAYRYTITELGLAVARDGPAAAGIKTGRPKAPLESRPVADAPRPHKA